MVNLRQVEAFRAVMLCGGVTAAAELMNVSQPAVSRLIRDFQRRTALKLFVRRGTRLVPTGEARALYQEVERSFTGLDRIAQYAAELRERRAGTVRIGALPALAHEHLPRFLAQFIAGRPRLNLTVHGLSTSAIVDLVAGGQCDLGLVEMPVEHPMLSVEPLAPLPTVAILPEHHRLAARERLGPADFEGEPFISLGQSTLLRFRVDAAFADAGVRRQMRIETQLTMMACSFAAAGAGLAIIDPITAASHAGRGIAIRPFSPRVDIELGIIHSTQRELPGVLQELIVTYSEAFETIARASAAA